MAELATPVDELPSRRQTLWNTAGLATLFGSTCGIMTALGMDLAITVLMAPCVSGVIAFRAASKTGLDAVADYSKAIGLTMAAIAASAAILAEDNTSLHYVPMTLACTAGAALVGLRSAVGIIQKEKFHKITALFGVLAGAAVGAALTCTAAVYNPSKFLSVPEFRFEFHLPKKERWVFAPMLLSSRPKIN